jgi:hypothetical protein
VLHLKVPSGDPETVLDWYVSEGRVAAIEVLPEIRQFGELVRGRMATVHIDAGGPGVQLTVTDPDQIALLLAFARGP